MGKQAKISPVNQFNPFINLIEHHDLAPYVLKHLNPDAIANLNETCRSLHDTFETRKIDDLKQIKQYIKDTQKPPYMQQCLLKVAHIKKHKRRCRPQDTAASMMQLLKYGDYPKAAKMLHASVHTLSAQTCCNILDVFLKMPQHITCLDIETFSMLVSHIKCHTTYQVIWHILWQEIENIYLRHNILDMRKVTRIFRMTTILSKYIDSSSINLKICFLLQQINSMSEIYNKNFYRENIKFHYFFTTAVQYCISTEQINALCSLTLWFIKQQECTDNLDILLKYAITQNYQHILSDNNKTTIYRLINTHLPINTQHLADSSFEYKKTFFNIIGRNKSYFSNTQRCAYIDIITQEIINNNYFIPFLFYFVDQDTNPIEEKSWLHILTYLDSNLKRFKRLLKQCYPFPRLYAQHLWHTMHQRMDFFMQPEKIAQTLDIMKQLSISLPQEDVIMMWNILIPRLSHNNKQKVLSTLEKIASILPPDNIQDMLKSYAHDDTITNDLQISIFELSKPYIYPGMLNTILKKKQHHTCVL